MLFFDYSPEYYGTWGFAGEGGGEGLRINSSKDRKYANSLEAVKRTKEIDDAGEFKFYKKIDEYREKGPNAHSKNKPCSYFATDVWNTPTGESLKNRHFAVGYSDPNVVADSINKANRKDHKVQSSTKNNTTASKRGVCE